ncbi:hypothetical protein [Streptomyces shenzhenensis]|uniref:hypothetical protein n=1 Tax=Streptomyces shenzhenensis TaxID=943815 RepID=UPI0011C3DEC6|nr:hypothetical protein [Streptomyces shenzhenensis]
MRRPPGRGRTPPRRPGPPRGSSLHGGHHVTDWPLAQIGSGATPWPAPLPVSAPWRYRLWALDIALGLVALIAFTRERTWHAQTNRLRASRPEISGLIDRPDGLLFAPADDLGVTPGERLTLAVYVAALHSAESADGYARRLREAGASDAYAAGVRRTASRDVAPGPYGVHKGGGALAAESRPGPSLTVTPELTASVGARTAQALRYAHLLVLHPRDARPGDLQEMFDAGWTQRQLIVIAQLVSALTLLLRVRAGAAVAAAWQRTNGVRA